VYTLAPSVEKPWPTRRGFFTPAAYLAAMTLDQFCALPPDDLPDLVHAWGLYLGLCRRAADSVFLYRYPGAGRGFFVELYKDRTTDTAPRVKAFASDLLLESDLSLWKPTEPAAE
jgi:hypothetical protein